MECDSYLWNGQLYTSSGIYHYVTTTAAGCDSVAKLDLIIYDPFYQGSITGADTLCKYNVPDTLQQDVPANGGDGSYSYQWLNSLDGILWMPIAGANTTQYISPALIENTYFTLVVSNICGQDTTNAVYDTLLPSPQYITIMGDSVFCANEKDALFWIDVVLVDINYNWQMIGGAISQQISDSAIVVAFDSIPGNSVIELTMIHDITGCELLIVKDVVKANQFYPNPTAIMRKPNSNILVCDDSTANIQYQWGFTEKATLIDTEISPGGNLRYVQLPHTFDSVTYRYWVHTWFDYGVGDVCETISYLGPSPITDVFDLDDQRFFDPYPNPSSGLFTIPFFENPQVYLSNTLGQQIPIVIQLKGNLQLLDISHLPDGLYFLSINGKKGMYRFTLVKQ